MGDNDIVCARPSQHKTSLACLAALQHVRSLHELRGLQERVSRGNARCLRGTSLANVLATHFAVFQKLLPKASLPPSHDLVHGWCGHPQDLSQALRETKPCRYILRDVTVRQIRHPATICFLERMCQARVSAAGVHAALKRGAVCHLAFVAVEVPLVERAPVGHINARHEAFDLRLDLLHLRRQSQENRFGEVVHTLVEQRLFRHGLSVPLLKAPTAIHHARMDNLPWVAKTDCDIVVALRDHGENTKQPLQVSNRPRSLAFGSDSSKNGALRAQDRGALTPLGEATGPRQRLETDESTRIGLCTKLARE
mmetsp:Transcript_17969/g.49279  ORF Transcript_17969/g.49279 Transcript_17969/m.49279 type:complete len:310 (+) Transcript_17969:17-946(+)